MRVLLIFVIVGNIVEKEVTMVLSLSLYIEREREIERKSETRDGM